MYVGVHGAATFESWNTYVNALSARFRKQVYDDPIAELRNLRQTDSLQDYMDAFDRIYPKAGITEAHSLTFFLVWVK